MDRAGDEKMNGRKLSAESDMPEAALVSNKKQRSTESSVPARPFSFPGQTRDNDLRAMSRQYSEQPLRTILLSSTQRLVNTVPLGLGNFERLRQQDQDDRMHSLRIRHAIQYGVGNAPPLGYGCPIPVGGSFVPSPCALGAPNGRTAFDIHLDNHLRTLQLLEGMGKQRFRGGFQSPRSSHLVPHTGPQTNVHPLEMGANGALGAWNVSTPGWSGSVAETLAYLACQSTDTSASRPVMGTFGTAYSPCVSPAALVPNAVTPYAHGRTANSGSQVPNHGTAIQVVPRSLPAAMAQPMDHVYLSPHQAYLRQHIEFFPATLEDCAHPTRGRNTPIRVGQVGLQCRHCRHVSLLCRPTSTRYFPGTMLGLYQAAQNMSTGHIQSGRCVAMPDSVKDEFVRLIPSKNLNSHMGRSYWANSAKQMGMVDTEHGIRFVPADN